MQVGRWICAWEAIRAAGATPTLTYFVILIRRSMPSWVCSRPSWVSIKQAWT